MESHLISNIKSRSANIGIIGMGYVGLPLIIRFVEEGFKTIGFDIDENKISVIYLGCSENKLTQEINDEFLNKPFIALHIIFTWGELLVGILTMLAFPARSPKTNE